MKKHLLLGVAAMAAVVASASWDTGPADAGGLRLLNFTRGTLQPVFAGGPTGAGVTNYVLDYKAATATDKAVKPGIRLELRTETGKVYGDTYDAATWRAATKLLNRAEAPASTASVRASEMAAGASVDALANFGAVDPNADDLEVRVYGLWDPVYRDPQGRTWAENRVLVLTYSRKGDEYDRQYDAVRFVSAKEMVDGEPQMVHASQ